MKLTGGQVVARGLRAYGVQYVAGVPGDGNSAAIEGLSAPAGGIPFIRVVNEQSAVHMADGYFRACGRAMAVVLPTKTGILTAAAALSNASSDSCGVLVVTGGRECGNERVSSEDPLQPDAESGQGALLPGLKQSLKVRAFSELSGAIQQAFNNVLDARPGPVHLEVPLEIQKHADRIGPELLQNRPAADKPRANSADIELAAAVLSRAERPVILAGSGVIAADATPELDALADLLSAPVLVGGNGVGAIPYDHALNAGSVSPKYGADGAAVLRKADVVVAVGIRLSGPSDIEDGKSTLDLEGKRLIQIDIERSDTGSCHQVEVSVVADVKSALADIKSALGGRPRRASGAKRQAFIELMHKLRADRKVALAEKSGADETLIREPRPFLELRKILHRDAIAVIGAGALARVAREYFPVYLPRTFLSPGASVAHGWAVPAAIGAKLAMPARQVVCVLEDSEFLHSMQEMAVSVMHCIPVVFVVFNQSGPEFVPGTVGSPAARPSIGEFSLPDGRPYSPAFADIARSFGLDAWRVEHASQLDGAIRRALDSTGSALIEVMIARHAADATLTRNLSDSHVHAV